MTTNNYFISKNEIIEIFKNSKKENFTLNQIIDIIKTANNEYDLKDVFLRGNPVVDNLMMSAVKKGKINNQGRGYQEAKLRLSYIDSFPAMQEYFIKLIKWINKQKKKGDQK